MVGQKKYVHILVLLILLFFFQISLEKPLYRSRLKLRVMSKAWRPGFCQAMQSHLNTLLTLLKLRKSQKSQICQAQQLLL